MEYDEPGIPATESAVQAAEHKLGIVFPPDFRHFLMTVNGGRPERTAFTIQWNKQPWAEFFQNSTVSYFYGLTDDEDDLDIVEEYEDWSERIPSITIPIGNDPGGALLLLIVKGERAGEVHYWVQDYEADFEGGEVPDFRNVGFIARSFSDFLSSLTAAD